jgi:hypothetical protein
MERSKQLLFWWPRVVVTKLDRVAAVDHDPYSGYSNNRIVGV